METRSKCSSRSSRSTPSFILPRDAGEERGEGLDVLNDWNDLNRRINKRP
jgi:hypothetical protein